MADDSASSRGIERPEKPSNSTGKTTTQTASADNRSDSKSTPAPQSNAAAKSDRPNTTINKSGARGPTDPNGVPKGHSGAPSRDVPKSGLSEFVKGQQQKNDAYDRVRAVAQGKQNLPAAPKVQRPDAPIAAPGKTSLPPRIAPPTAMGGIAPPPQTARASVLPASAWTQPGIPKANVSTPPFNPAGVGPVAATGDFGQATNLIDRLAAAFGISGSQVGGQPGSWSEPSAIDSEAWNNAQMSGIGMADIEAQTPASLWKPGDDFKNLAAARFINPNKLQGRISPPSMIAGRPEYPGAFPASMNGAIAGQAAGLPSPGASADGMFGEPYDLAPDTQTTEIMDQPEGGLPPGGDMAPSQYEGPFQQISDIGNRYAYEKQRVRQGIAGIPQQILDLFTGNAQITGPGMAVNNLYDRNGGGLDQRYGGQQDMRQPPQRSQIDQLIAMMQAMGYPWIPGPRAQRRQIRRTFT